MAITLEANYPKKLGLPNYSSHQYSVTVRTEVSRLDKIDEASQRLYRQLQDAVDRDIQETGFLPGNEGSEQTSDMPPFQRGGNGTRGSQSRDSWNCSDKQRGLIEKLMDEHKLSFDEVDELARFRFRSGLKDLNKMSASGLIDELIDTHGSKSKAGNRGGRR